MSRGAASDQGIAGGTGELSTSRASWASAAREAVRRALEGAVAATPGAGVGSTLWIQITAPLISIDAALTALRSAADSDGDELLWDPPAGPAFAGRGAAAIVPFTDAATTRQRAEGIFQRWQDLTPSTSGPAPRWFGAIAFAPGPPRLPWRDFGDGRFVLPRVRYARDGEAAFVAFAFNAAWLASRGALLDETDRVIAALAAADDERAPASGMRCTVAETPRARWKALLGEILSGIAAGRFRKVVAARRTVVTALGERPSGAPSIDSAGDGDGDDDDETSSESADIRPHDVAHRLRASAEGCTRFLLRAGSTTFLGATPERLVARHGERITTEALAGSIGAEVADGAARLLGSDKDLVEHALVVEGITRRLDAWCEALTVPPAPSVRALRHLLHLHTPIEGRLRRAAHVLDLVGALHPTPAVGGLPADEALAWIAEREGADRGLYAGPVGWFDAAGDGEFAVALRSAAISGDRAWLWVGAGIVAGSDADREYDETALKQRGMLGAIVGEP